ARYTTPGERGGPGAARRASVAEGASRAKPTVTLPLVPRAEPVYPEAAAESPEAAAEELADVFDFLDDWAERYHYIIELGQKLPPLPDEFRTEPNRVQGCQSTVYLSARKKPGTADVLEFVADSDADIVRGELAILQRAFSGQKASAVLAFDVQGFFKRLGLDQHLTLGRRNGLAGMVQRIRAHAAKLAGVKTP